MEVLDEEDGLEETLLKDELSEEAELTTLHPVIIPINAKSITLFFANGFIKTNSFDIYYYKYKPQNLK